MKRLWSGKSVAAVLGVAFLAAAAVPPEAPVADAAMRGDVEQVRSLLQGGADVNAAQGDGMTALHWAAEGGSAEMAGILLYAGANSGAVTRIGEFTPLHVASRAGNTPVVSVLVGSGADPNVRTSTGEAALHYAAAAGALDLATLLIKAGAEVDALETSSGQTALMFAGAYGRTAMIDLLVAAGADASLESHLVDYPTVGEEDRVAAKERAERLAYLHGDPVKFNPGVDGTTAAEEEEKAKESEHKEAASELEDSKDVRQPGEFDDAQAPGAQGPDDQDPDEPESEEPESSDAERRPFSYAELVGMQGGNTALHYAAREGHRDAVMALLDAGQDINHVSRGDKTSPLLMATLNGHFDLAMELLDRGADPRLASAPGATPLYAAVHLQWVPKSFYPQQTAIKQQHTTYLELMEALLEAGADPNARLERHLWYTSFNHNVLGVDTWGATPFWRAAYGTDVEAMKLLVAYGADPTIPTKRPPGRVATGNGEDDSEVKEDPSGLDPVEVGGAGVYPVHAASGTGYGLGLAGNAHRHAPGGWLPAVKYLVEELGADANARDYNGFAPLHNAAARGDREMIDYLVSKGGDVTVLTRKGETTADMANGPVQRVTVFPEIVAHLESLGSANNDNCVSCE